MKDEPRVITCSKCERFLAILEGNKVTTQCEVETTGIAYGRKSGAYIKCKCGHKEEFIY